MKQSRLIVPSSKYIADEGYLPVEDRREENKPDATKLSWRIKYVFVPAPPSIADREIQVTSEVER